MKPQLFWFVALALLVAAPSYAGERPVCDTGSFVVEGNPIRTRSGGETTDRIELGDGEIRVESLGTTKLRVRGKKDGTLVRARFGKPRRGETAFNRPGFSNQLAAWSWNVLMGLVGYSGGGGERPFHLRAWISPDCSTMEGVVRHGRTERVFAAHAPAPLPDPACLTVWIPVCGDDGATYSNACYAAQAGAEVAYEGECAAECGTIVGIPCGEGEFCEMPDDTCSSADLGGTCVAVPQICTHQYDPVCGCDNVTYPNDCERRAALVNKGHDGACAQ
jgi:hypothetical protein